MSETSYCRDHVRAYDPDRYLATLFAPADRQPALFALYAFHVEITKVCDAVSGPLPGEMRLQWWRECLGGEARGDAASHPIASVLLEAIARFELPVAAFIQLIDAHTFDLYTDPMPSLSDLEAYCAATASTLVHLACRILGSNTSVLTTVEHHIGVAIGLTGLLRRFAWDASHNRVYLPQEMLNAQSLSRESLCAGQGGSGLLTVLRSVREQALVHLEQAGLNKPIRPRSSRAAFLPAYLVKPYLKQMSTPDYGPYRTRIDLLQLRKLVTFLAHMTKPAFPAL